MGFIFDILYNIITIYSWILIIYILMSWFPNARHSQIGIFFARLSEPYLEPFRKIVPPLGMIDFSPIVAILVLRLAGNGLYQLFMWFN